MNTDTMGIDSKVDTKDDTGTILKNLGRLHTTQQGAMRIRRNLRLDAAGPGNGGRNPRDAEDTADVVDWCRKKIEIAKEITRNGKNWYICAEGVRITVNACSYTIITAHRQKSAPFGSTEVAHGRYPERE